ncbi:PREDICTED: putative uncharacterized protein DDB_G0290521 [Nicotiana attenuata]|uniref:Uncharacterized protein n=1 Tax=Nicotiana attenuata TaxID=49451 RepID=A0A1J6I1K5_NICAT|nr:PREDICTED: putative uncharacterized protein DDB_G0290521 [Nicotiana attenuata]OIS98940.1 hypothetical protein A4A49_20388 [Nicotiana attenuata]
MTSSIHSSSAVLHHPSATTAAVSTGENCRLKSVSLKRKSPPPPPSSPSDEPSPKKITLHPPPSSSSTAAATERVPEKTPSPAFSPFSSKRVSDKSPFSTCSTTTTNNPAISPLPFSRFTTTQPHNNILRRTLSEPPVFNSFTAFVTYMNSQSPENDKNINISAFNWQRPLRRSISVPTDADILAPAAVNSEKTTKRKILIQFLNEGDDHLF